MKYNPWELKSNLVINFLVEDRLRIFRHLLFLGGFFILIYFARFWHWYSEEVRYYVLFFAYASLIIMAYINIYVLVPHFFFKTRYITYFFLLVLLGIAGINLIGYGFNVFFSAYKIVDIPQKDDRGFYEGVMMCVLVILTTTTVKLLQKWTKDNRKIAELNDLTLNMELNELRNQINPHFLFNTLNNVKALIRTDPEKASTIIIKLSEFLRYQLYENSEEKTFLTSEIEFLSNFINLEKIRRENFNAEISLNADKRILNNTFIPPNIFTTFVENAIKHSVDLNGKESHVNIDIKIENQKLYFTCSNSKDVNFFITNKNCSGLGLANIKRRLELLYGKTHCLEAFSTEKEFIINLMIPL